VNRPDTNDQHIHRKQTKCKLIFTGQINKHSPQYAHKKEAGIPLWMKSRVHPTPKKIRQYMTQLKTTFLLIYNPLYLYLTQGLLTQFHTSKIFFKRKDEHAHMLR